MNKKTEKKLNMLFMNNAAREALYKADKLHNSSHKQIRDSAPNLLVIAPEGSGLTTYAEVYSEILDSSENLKVRGRKTYIELTFPKDNEKDERRFFLSPVIAADYCNRFYGTMVVSLREFSGTDLIKSKSLVNLLEFVELNKNNIKFIFHILPEFSADKKLLSKLREITNVDLVELEKPNAELALLQLIGELSDSGVSMSEEAINILRSELLPYFVNQDNYRGYKSLKLLIDRLYREMGMSNENETNLLLYDYMVVDLMNDIRKENDERNDNACCIGFRTEKRPDATNCVGFNK